jgi:hypothetical protein
MKEGLRPLLTKRFTVSLFIRRNLWDAERSVKAARAAK